MRIYTIIILFILFGLSSKINAQIGIAHEIGVVFGPVMFKSDYGARNDFGTNINNNGFGIGLVHYLNFSYNSNKSTFFQNISRFAPNFHIVKVISNITGNMSKTIVIPLEYSSSEP